jgi:outer membrane murein-binding lipoprotein Lpp
MSKESKVLLAVTVLCTLFLAGFMYFLQSGVVASNVQTLQAVVKAVSVTPSPKATAEPTEAATGSATPKGKVSTSPVVKASAKATEEPEATVEATPEK